MADNNEKKGVIHWLWENLDTIAIIGTVAAGFFSGRVSEDADPKAKKAAAAMGMSTGGKGDPTDEAFYKGVKAKVGTSANRKTLQKILTGFTTYAFQLTHDEKWVRERGRDAFEDWRVIICRIGQTDEQVAVDYLTAFAKDLRDKYTEICKDRSVTAWPFDEGNVEHRIARCEAFDYGIEQMRSDGTYVPTGTEASLIIRLKNLALQMGPKAFAAGKTAYDKTYQHIKDNGPEYVDKTKQAAQHSWEATKETAAAHADWMEQHATERKQQDANLRWHDQLLNKLLPF